MPTATETTTSTRNAAIDKVTKLNGRAVSAGKSVGGVYLGTCMKTVGMAVAAGRKSSGQPRKVARGIVDAQTAVVGKLTETYSAMSSKVLAA